MDDGEDGPNSADRNVQEWMLICQNNAQFEDADVSANEDMDWSLAGEAYTDLHEMPSFIDRQRQDHSPQSHSTAVDPGNLQGQQLRAYNIVREHFLSEERQEPLRMIVSGTAGTGKSYLIECLQQLLGDCLRVAAPTGGAAYNVHGHTVHSLVSIPVRGDFKEMEGQRLHTIQESLDGVDYLIVDEISMVGRAMFGKMDRRLRQAFPQR